MTRKKGPQPLGDLVGDVLAKQGLTRRVDLAGAVERWTEVVGARVAANARAESVTADGILWVKVRSSPWAMELSLMAPRIIAKLNEDRNGRIKEIRCVVGLAERKVEES